MPCNAIDSIHCVEQISTISIQMSLNVDLLLPLPPRCNWWFEAESPLLLYIPVFNNSARESDIRVYIPIETGCVSFTQCLLTPSCRTTQLLAGRGPVILKAISRTFTQRSSVSLTAPPVTMTVWSNVNNRVVVRHSRPEWGTKVWGNHHRVY